MSSTSDSQDVQSDRPNQQGMLAGSDPTAKNSARGRIIGFVIALVVIVAAIAAFFIVRAQRSSSSAESSATSSQSTSGSSTKERPDTSSKSGSASASRSGKVLIVYFSRTQGVYGASNGLQVGNTARIAHFIRDCTGGDEYEIVPAKDYPSDYTKTTQVAQQEQQSNARPAIKNPLPDVSGYSTVFVGAPVWWGEYPMIVRTFMDKVDLNGKTVIPFDTNEGSGMANFREQLQKQYPKATVPEGLAVEGNEAASARGQVDSWLRGLKIAKK